MLKIVTILMTTLAFTANGFAQALPVVGSNASQVKEQIALETMTYELEKAFVDLVVSALEDAEANSEWVKQMPTPENIVLDNGAEIAVIGGEALASLAAVLYGGKVVTQEVFQKLITKHPVLAKIIDLDRQIAAQEEALRSARSVRAQRAAKIQLRKLAVSKADQLAVKPSVLARVARGGVRAVPVAVAGLAAASAVTYVTFFNYGNIMTLVQTKSEREAMIASLKQQSEELEALIAIGNN